MGNEHEDRLTGEVLHTASANMHQPQLTAANREKGNSHMLHTQKPEKESTSIICSKQIDVIMRLYNL